MRRRLERGLICKRGLWEGEWFSHDTHVCSLKDAKSFELSHCVYLVGRKFVSSTNCTWEVHKSTAKDTISLDIPYDLISSDRLLTDQDLAMHTPMTRILSLNPLIPRITHHLQLLLSRQTQFTDLICHPTASHTIGKRATY